VIAVPAGGPGPSLDGPVVCGVADSDKDAPAARAADRLALRLGTRLTLVHVTSLAEGRAAPRDTVNAAHRGILWQALHTLDATPPVDLVREHGDPARRLTGVAERAEAALLVIGIATDTAGGDQGADADLGVVAGTVLADSRLPVMLVPRTSVDMAAEHAAAAAPLRA
jgi:nucleotide-binding universal stress UspA family protein